MSRRAKAQKDIGQVKTYDLQEIGDGLLLVSLFDKGAERIPATSTQLNVAYSSVVKSGWNKPTIQLAMLLALKSKNLLEVGGERRLVRLLTSQAYDVIVASQLRSLKMLEDLKSFESLAIWVNRPFSLKPYNKKAKRRIGVGYSDMGSSLPNHQKGRNLSPNSIYLGEKQEFAFDLYPGELKTLVQDYGFLLNHIDCGWWEPSNTLKALYVISKYY